MPLPALLIGPTVALLPLSAPPATNAAATALFPQGTQLFTADVRYGVGNFGDGDPHLPTVALGWDYFAFDDFSIGVELQGFGVLEDAGDAAGVALRVRGRHHVVTWEDGSFFLGGGFGPSYADQPTPDGGSPFNFVTTAGIGVAQALDERTYLITGLDYYHLSNAHIPDTANPAINGIQAYVGLAWRF